MHIHGIRRLLAIACIVVAAAGIQPEIGEAGVVVICNRTTAKVNFIIGRPDGREARHAVTAGELVSIPYDGKLGIQFDSEGAPRRSLLGRNSIYSFVDEDEKLELIELTLQAPLAAESSAEEKGKPQPDASKLAPIYTVAVKLLTDDDEPAVQRIWEGRLRERLSKVSEITERHCRVRFEVAAVETWESDDETDDFEELLRDFEKKVKPAPARLAIGFMGQYRRMKGRTHMGGIRGPMHSHILIREWSQHLSTTEQTEILLHELGHFLGAAHSPQGDSVMRPIHGDHRSHAREFRIGFDPLNTLIMYLLGEELRSGKYRGFANIHPSRKQRLRMAYSVLESSMPNDKAAAKYLRLLDPSSGVPLFSPPETSLDNDPLAGGVRAILAAVTEAAERNHNRKSDNGGQTRMSGDRLSEFYVRQAAKAAGELPREVAPKAFLLALGMGMDRKATLRKVPIVGGFCRRVESEEQCGRRLAVLGFPTLRGRHDLAQHFFVSCALSVLIGGQEAESAGLLKEIKDSRGAGGFSFADLAADMAGVTFASGVGSGKLPLSGLAASFSVKRFMPEIDSLEEGIAWEDFAKTYGLSTDARFQRKQITIRKQIMTLPGYSAATSVTPKADR